MGAAENSGETKNKPRVHGQPKDGSSSSRIKRKQQPAAPSDSRHTRGLAWVQAGWLKNLGWAGVQHAGRSLGMDGMDGMDGMGLVFLSAPATSGALVQCPFGGRRDPDSCSERWMGWDGRGTVRRTARTVEGWRTWLWWPCAWC